jgi:Tol biopolymer transport system component
MSRRRILAVIATLCAGLALTVPFEATGQHKDDRTKWEYKAVPFGPNVDRSTKMLNELAADGWIYVGPLAHDQVAFKRPVPGSAPGKPQFVYASKRDGNFEIYLMNLDGTDAKNLTKNPAQDRDPNWSPDGLSIVFVSDRDGTANVYTMDADGGNVKQITKGARKCGWPAWSPDGKKILFLRESDKGGQFFTVELQGGKEQQLTGLKGEGDAYDPCWSPDGKKIVFTSSRNGGFRVHVMDADGGNVQVITNQNEFGWVMPAWSPDGKKIAYAKDTGGTGVEVFTCDPDGKNEKQLTKLNNINTFAAWSRDSKQIIFQQAQFRTVENPAPLYVMDADGGNLRMILAEDGPGRPAWRPTPKKAMAP